LNVDDRHLGPLGSLPSIASVLTATPTTARGTKMCDNMLYNRQATVEFTGRAGVLDVLSELNLTMAQTLELSDHLPIWAEFSAYEGGQPGHFAERMETDARHWRR
jgi:deoxyribonuclease-1-like protein